MPQPTPVEVIDAVQVFISEYLDRPREELVFNYDPHMRCDGASPVDTSPYRDAWAVHVRNAYPEDDGLRISIAEFLLEKYGIMAEVELAWR